ncbi:undecaprenyl/decaprenyl-phosphate alpha-N-acetylglucosaminyl 1-phosphate transferase [Rossellomorea aquimaris]|uniref:glycosyltransferase family 4 protein n=1 Tax=Rossellomorea aquimaris TaxID=189382 RepID=UPI001CD5C9D8|nr:MraY family glycosyltransferase [Rossellomorea aquimaris]MCA1060795.1 undecaprenyl/decaprenyl-phosphate alpha-N-acetylglucosaminyl 1-phosphate transferase [Rossellomorea aquimaris]
MYSLIDFIIAFAISLIVSLAVTPFVIKFAKKYGFVDKPDYRKVHKNLMPRIGGLSIVIGATAGLLYLNNLISTLWPVLIGGGIIIIVGILDDKFTLSPKAKLVGQFLAAFIVVFADFKIDFITLPFVTERIYLGNFSYVFGILWIVGITNAINLIDGLDGLAGGVSVIAMTSIAALAAMNGQFIVVGLTVILIGGTIGFLFFNFNPAKIFMGDTGALFLGYCISIISLLGLYKSVTIFSLVVPIIILAIPIFDTFFAIIRRILNKQSISAPDKSHLHHRLLALGYSHKETVLLIYAIGAFFGLCAILFTRSTLWGAVLFIGVLVLIIQVTAEIIGLMGQHKPLINTMKKIRER